MLKRRTAGSSPLGPEARVRLPRFRGYRYCAAVVVVETGDMVGMIGLSSSLIFGMRFGNSSAQIVATCADTVGKPRGLSLGDGRAVRMSSSLKLSVAHSC